MSLRTGAVETLRLADHDYDRLEQQEHPEGKAGFKLDRLLDFLDAAISQEPATSTGEERTRRSLLRFVAALRGTTEEQ